MNERHEGVVRMDAQMWALVAEMWACVVQMEAMKAANQLREHRGEAQAYPESSFMDVHDDLFRIVLGLEEI